MNTPIDLALARLTMLETAVEQFYSPASKEEQDELKNMTTPIDEVFARLSVLEFGLEIMMTQTFLAMPPAELDVWEENFLRLMRSPVLPDCFSNEHKEAEFCRLAVQMAENLMKKIRVRMETARRVSGG
jgi:hypothetical protein